MSLRILGGLGRVTESHRTPVLGLAGGQILVWCALYYLFPALLLRWERDLGWSKAELTGAFSLAVLASALVAPFFGRLIDRGHGRTLLTLSALCGGLLVSGLALVESLPLFYALWLLIGLAMGGALYEPCFAYVTKVCGLEARGAITLITLVAGFAGTLTFPSATLLAEIDWRWAALVFGLVSVLVAAPLFWWSGGRLERDHHQETTAALEHLPRNDPAVIQILRQPAFWFLGLAFAFVGLDHALLLNHLLSLLDERGLDGATAVLLASLIGPMQVAGRFAVFLAGSRGKTLPVTYACLVAMLGAATVLSLSGTSFLLLLVFVALQGSGMGISSIMKPVVTAELLGRRGFGLISGMMAVLFLSAFAAAPFVGSLIWEAGGYRLVQICVIAMAAAALAGLAAAHLAARRQMAAD